MAKHILPSQAYLRECFDYDPETGTLTWRERPLSHFPNINIWRQRNAKLAGKKAGYVESRVLIRFGREKRMLQASRIIWKWMTGDDPSHEIDHINRNALDNRWINLRAATRHENVCNRGQGKRLHEGIGLKGVYQVKGQRNYFAQIRHHQQTIYLGTFPTIEAAHAAYCEAAKKIHGEFWNPG